VAAACKDLNVTGRSLALPGIELTHIPPESFAGLTRKARSLGAVIVVAHGGHSWSRSTRGQNRAAIEAGVDILAHPG